jgi:hypothetical protein
MQHAAHAVYHICTHVVEPFSATIVVECLSLFCCLLLLFLGVCYGGLCLVVADGVGCKP